MTDLTGSAHTEDHPEMTMVSHDELDAIEQRLEDSNGLGDYPCCDEYTEDYLDTLAASASDVPRLLAEVRRLQAADERVRALHHPVEIEPSDTICGECSYRMPNGRYLPVVEHPCPTIDALDGGDHD